MFIDTEAAFNSDAYMLLIEVHGRHTILSAARQISAKFRVNGAWAAVSMVSQPTIVSYIRRP